jgi:hypothetical protein
MPGISTSEPEPASASASVSFGAGGMAVDVVVVRNGSSMAKETVLYLEAGARSPFEWNGDTLRRLDLDCWWDGSAFLS